MMTVCFAIAGRWTGVTWTGVGDVPAVSIPEGAEPLEGDPRALLAAGAMLPPEPPPTSDRVAAWTWDAAALRYVPTPSALAVAREQREAIRQQMLDLEARAMRPLLELAVDPAHAEAQARLDDLRAQIATLRAAMPPLPPTGA